MRSRTEAWISFWLITTVELRKRSTTRHIADVSRMLPVAYGVVMVLVVVGLMAMYLDVTRGVSL